MAMSSNDYIRIYAIYKGDSFVDVGTYDELSRTTGFTKKSLYSMITPNRRTPYQVYYIGKELIPMYDRLIERLAKMQASELKLSLSDRPTTAARHEGAYNAIGTILAMVKAMQKQEEEYEEAERQGEYLK